MKALHFSELGALAAAAGRDPIPVSVFSARATPEHIEHYASIGVSRAIFGLPPAGAAEVVPRLKHHAEAMKAIA